MKKIGKYLLRVLTLTLVTLLVVTLLPYAREWLGALLPEGKYQRASQLLTHQMEKAGELTAVRHTDTGVMTAHTDALLIGTVQRVSVPYTYEIGLGFSLKDVRLTATEDGIQAALPAVRMLFDSFQVTGAPQIEDFWYRLSETQYQKMLDEQAAACRSAYLENDALMQEAWAAACETLTGLFQQWSGEALPLSFVHTGDSQAPQ